MDIFRSREGEIRTNMKYIYTKISLLSYKQSKCVLNESRLK